MRDVYCNNCERVLLNLNYAKEENDKLKADNLLALDISKKFADERDELKGQLEEASGWKIAHKILQDAANGRIAELEAEIESNRKHWEKMFDDAKLSALNHSKELEFRGRRIDELELMVKSYRDKLLEVRRYIEPIRSGLATNAQYVAIHVKNEAHKIIVEIDNFLKTHQGVEK